MSDLSELHQLKRRLEEGVIVVPFCTCWLFTEAGRENRNGYSRLWWKGKERMAHILSYEAHVGPVPSGLLVDHRCRMRCCINPDHLEPVTPRVNTLRGETLLFGHGRCPVTGQAKEKIHVLPHTTHPRAQDLVHWAGPQEGLQAVEDRDTFHDLIRIGFEAPGHEAGQLRLRPYRYEPGVL